MMHVEEKFKDENKKNLTRIFDFSMFIIGSAYNKLTSMLMDIITEFHLRILRRNRDASKKILGYWDFNQRLGKLGDFTIFLETLNALREEFNLNVGSKNIDICFIDDKNHHNANWKKFSKTYYFKKMLSSLYVINPYIDSAYFFQSNDEFEIFFTQNKDKYIRWPATVSGTAVYDVRLIEKSYQKSGKLSLLKVPQEVLANIYDFYEKKVYPALPIIINFRRNVDRDLDKNSDLGEIKKFIKKYEKSKDYKFIIICNKAEIPEDLRSFTNVLFSKDYFTNLEQDLALIQSSYISIFPSSGMSAFAWYADVPFIQFGYYGTDAYSTPLKGRLNHFTEYQRVCKSVTEKADLLIPEFESLIFYLQKNKINNTLKNQIVIDKKYISQF